MVISHSSASAAAVRGERRVELESKYAGSDRLRAAQVLTARLFEHRYCTVFAFGRQIRTITAWLSSHFWTRTSPLVTVPSWMGRSSLSTVVSGSVSLVATV